MPERFNKRRAAEQSPPENEKENAMPTMGEIQSVKNIEASLRKISQELELANKLAALKLRMEYDENMGCKEAMSELKRITGVK